MTDNSSSSTSHNHEHKGCNHDDDGKDHEHGHSHNHGVHAHLTGDICMLEQDKEFQKKLKLGNKAFKKLTVVVVICFLFMIVEVVGGLISGSLAILTDAAHMLSDVGGFMISMFSIWIG